MSSTLEGTNLKLGYNKKITTKHEGPFLITEVLGPVNYRLKLLDKWRMRDNFHATLLTPYTENTVHGENYTRPSPDLINGEEEWEIERIMGHKGTKNIMSNGKDMTRCHGSLRTTCAILANRSTTTGKGNKNHAIDNAIAHH